MPHAELHFFMGKRDERTHCEAKERLLNIGKRDKLKNNFCEMKGDVGMSCQSEQEDAYTKTESFISPFPTSLFFLKLLLSYICRENTIHTDIQMPT